MRENEINTNLRLKTTNSKSDFALNKGQMSEAAGQDGVGMQTLTITKSLF